MTTNTTTATRLRRVAAGAVLAAAAGASILIAAPVNADPAPDQLDQIMSSLKDLQKANQNFGPQPSMPTDRISGEGYLTGPSIIVSSPSDGPTTKTGSAPTSGVSSSGGALTSSTYDRG